MPYMADKTSFNLRRIQNLTAQYSRDVQAIWCPESQGTDPSMESQVPISPFYAMKPLSIQQSLLSRNGNKNRPGRSFAASSQQDPGLPNDDDSGSDGSDDDDDELFQGLNLDSLKSRGKGEHYCPKRFDCTKGGVDENGKLVAFVRNSAYLYVYLAATMTIWPAAGILTAGPGNIATNTSSLGGATSRTALTRPRSESLLGETD